MPAAPSREIAKVESSRHGRFLPERAQAHPGVKRERERSSPLRKTKRDKRHHLAASLLGAGLSKPFLIDRHFIAHLHIQVYGIIYGMVYGIIYFGFAYGMVYDIFYFGCALAADLVF